MSDSDLIALLAVVTTIVIGFFTYRHHLRLLNIEKKKEDERKIEKSSADMRVYFTEKNRGDYIHEYLTIENVGEDEARNIEVKIDGYRLTNYSSVQGGIFPIKYIGKKSKIEFPLIYQVALDQFRDWEIEIGWEDDINKENIFRTVISK